MFGLFKKKFHRPQVHRKAAIRFVDEQDGPSERELKAKVAESFSVSGKVLRAYLVRVTYDNADAHEVALCIRGAEDRAMVNHVAACFAGIFSRDAHLDIMFLTEAQESELRVVCKPFFAIPSV